MRRAFDIRENADALTRITPRMRRHDARACVIYAVAEPGSRT
ncbi:hypothetical protein C7S13_8432 [Burkholderia cepacia]|nr:hypothetical protein [Burkholderia cepacia]